MNYQIPQVEEVFLNLEEKLEKTFKCGSGVFVGDSGCCDADRSAGCRSKSGVV